MKKKEILFGAIDRATRDQEFRKKFIENPTKELSKVSGRKFKFKKYDSISVTAGSVESVKDILTFNQDTRTIAVIVPNEGSFSNIQLTDDQLESVAGGKGLLDRIGEMLRDYFKL